ncbi:TROVE domain-containing protein [Chryseobacterium arthrosphaerae]|uniref:TROVE domain-containing protein n=1 Tax=Chryseobacterium arthrosphaerae TaxID=651561 RepID=UPI001F4B52D7|nr:TROVE domain-containing protein [Chryseobacterium arthrosphaerae]MDG4652292.1 TROVE domain-containing protein [Chryseobacterium arthrosphaerae]
MSKFNTKKTGFDSGIIAGTLTDTAGKYSDYELLRRVTLANLLFESDYYQSADTIMKQIEDLCHKVDGEKIIELAMECRFKQKLRHTPLWLLILANEIHGVSVKDALAKVANRPDMTIDLLQMLKVRNGSYKMSKPIKKGLAKAFDQYDEYQISKYRKSNMTLSLIDVVNLVHPKPTAKNEYALKALVEDTLQPANTWETALSQGADKKETFERMISEKSLGSMAILRNLRNMTEAGLSRADIRTAISQVSSSWLTPLNFLAAQRNAVEFTADIDQAMEKCFSGEKIKGTTILAIDVSGSMGQITSSQSKFSRMDLAFAMAAAGSYIFEDLILVFTAGDDYQRTGKHMIWSNGKGLGLFNNYQSINAEVGHGGIFTYQLCEWLKEKGYAKDADRLVVISDSQDIDAHYGSDKKPDTSPYKTSYIIDISTHTHGIKTGNWTAEINGWSDKVFHYIKALES